MRESIRSEIPLEEDQEDELLIGDSDKKPLGDDNLRESQMYGR